MVALVPHGLSTTLFAGRYHLLEEMGRGSFSRVFLAQDTHNRHQLVAIKRLRQNGLPTNLRGTARQSYRREAAVLRHLSHTRIPRLHDAQLEGGCWYLVVDAIAGETLETYLTRHNALLPLHEVLDIGLQLCDVLSYLHQHRPPMKFRDLKPANIMRQPDGQLTLIDFGLACPDTGSIDAVTLGTPGYAAPEQYANAWGQGAATIRSDLYSFGAILHQLLNGCFPSKKPLAAMFTFSSLIGKTPPDLAKLVAQMLAYEPGQRPQIQEVQAILQTVQRTTARS